MKKIKILIIILITLIILGGATFATLYFATDIFKSEQEMFYKYIKQVDLSTFTNLEDSEKYLERISNEKTSNSGNISVDVVVEDEMEIAEEYVYEIKNDPASKMSSATINVNQEGQEGLTLNYLRNQDLYGIMIPDVLTQYIIFENNNLKEFAQRLEIEDIDEIPDRIELTLPENTKNIDINQLSQILDKYIDIIIKGIPKENYSKTDKQEIILENSKMEVDGYQLSITAKDLRNILFNILNTLKNDQELFDLMISLNEENMSFAVYSEGIGYLIEELENSEELLDAEKEIINIKVLKKGKETVKIYSQIKIDEEQKVEIAINNLQSQIELVFKVINNNEYYNSEVNMQVMQSKNIEEQEQTNVRINVKEDELDYVDANITLNRNGRLDSQRITNTGSIDIKINVPDIFVAYGEESDTSENSININFTNNTVFDNNIQIEEYNDENLAIINYFGKEPIQYLVTSIAEGASQKIDLEKNLILGPLVVITSINSSLQTDLFTSAQNAANQVETEMYEENQLSSGHVTINGEDFEYNISDMVVQTFNSQFTVYEGDNKSGSQVRALINSIEASNSTQINQVSYTDIAIELNKKYSITFIKDAEGYINRAIITEM